MADSGPVFRTGDGVTVAIRVTPKAGRQRVEGMVADASGQLAIKITVTAAPENGKANKAVIAFLARTWKIPKSHISLQAGLTSRNKILKITGDTAALKGKIEETLETPHHA